MGELIEFSNEGRNGGHPFPFVIYSDEQPVGFVMLAYGTTGYDEPSRLQKTTIASCD